MGKFIRLVNGIPRSFDESGSPAIYDQTLEVVASGAGAGQINGPISAATPITLPASQTYTSNELQVYLNGQRVNPGAAFDYTYTSTTQIAFTFTIQVGDIIRFYIDRAP